MADKREGTSFTGSQDWWGEREGREKRALKKEGVRIGSQHQKKLGATFLCLLGVKEGWRTKARLRRRARKDGGQGEKSRKKHKGLERGRSAAGQRGP